MLGFLCKKLVINTGKGADSINSETVYLETATSLAYIVIPNTIKESVWIETKKKLHAIILVFSFRRITVWLKSWRILQFRMKKISRISVNIYLFILPLIKAHSLIAIEIISCIRSLQFIKWLIMTTLEENVVLWASSLSTSSSKERVLPRELSLVFWLEVRWCKLNFWSVN